EIAITRYLSKDGESGYRLNGARCRLVDVAEVLSDTGLGKEMHSVVSQGRVEAIIHSKPRDRRLLIEEAAGLGKHRKRRRRAQLTAGGARPRGRALGDRGNRPPPPRARDDRGDPARYRRRGAGRVGAGRAARG